ncbi:hypothetical protein OMO38_17060 [Chryseobacterium sp. 09-1422]|uniref:Uncharacterized protein n=1 Tax=Chryseobacterium kimseyorum TaxID=2984028 RepID=A0ABT3I2V2_9FLAO|nr:hypothetical protein [Chryseobacterium kimseyorum]MCW3170240.1 hypothetical protein [Chryseobacterium kimseyorum]
MKKKTYLILLISLFLFSCKDKAENEDFKKTEDYADMVLGIPQAQIDSIQKSEAKKQVFLKKVSYELDSATSVDLMLPMSNYLKEYSFSSDINVTDPNSTAEINEAEIPMSVGVQNPFSEGDSGEVLLIGKSSNPNVFPVSDIKKFNEAEKILFEDKNALLFIDGFGRKKLFYRQYNPVNSTYYLYTAEVPKYNDQKLQYASLFSIYIKAQNLLAFDNESPAENMTWEKIKPSLSETELKNYGVYYKSMAKELKYFLKDNDSVNINRDKMQFYLYRDEDHSKNTFDQVTSLANSEYSGIFYDLNFENRLHKGYFRQMYSIDDQFRFIKKISDQSILVSATRSGYNSDDSNYYIISSIKTEKGQFYLISPTNENGDDLTSLMNDYFSKHLKI